MGCIQSKEDKEAFYKSKEIDSNLKKDAILEARSVKILLLGAGEAGKSTFLKQMRVLYLSGYTAEQRLEYTPVVHSNTIQSLAVILKAMTRLDISFSDPSCIFDRDDFLDRVAHQDVVLTPNLASTMDRLWQDAGVQACYRRAREYQLSDSAEYFLSALDRISAPDYLPLDRDILRTRVKTTGISEISFNYRALLFRIIDIGGQRSERRKWIHCFEGATCIIFLVAMSEYDLTLAEDNCSNRIHESMKLFEAICNNKWFNETSLVLFLNKRDIFLSKITTSPLTIAYPDYTGASNFEECSVFMQSKFEGLSKSKSRVIYTHFTCVADTASTRFLFLSVTDTIIRNNLKDCGLL